MPEILVQATVTQAAFKPAFSPDGERIIFGCIGRAATKPMCMADANGANVVILVDDPKVDENHFSWGVASA